MVVARHLRLLLHVKAEQPDERVDYLRSSQAALDAELQQRGVSLDQRADDRHRLLVRLGRRRALQELVDQPRELVRLRARPRQVLARLRPLAARVRGRVLVEELEELRHRASPPACDVRCGAPDRRHCA